MTSSKITHAEPTSSSRTSPSTFLTSLPGDRMPVRTNRPFKHGKHSDHVRCVMVPVGCIDVRDSQVVPAPLFCDVVDLVRRRIEQTVYGDPHGLILPLGGLMRLAQSKRL